MVSLMSMMWIWFRVAKMYGSHLRVPVASTLAEVDTRFNEFLDE